MFELPSFCIEEGRFLFERAPLLFREGKALFLFERAPFLFREERELILIWSGPPRKIERFFGPRSPLAAKGESVLAHAHFRFHPLAGVFAFSDKQRRKVRPFPPSPPL